MTKVHRYFGVIVGVGLVAAAAAGEPAADGTVALAPMLEKHWADHYADIQALMTEIGPKGKDFARFKEQAAAKSDAVQALIWETDRHPTDVALRRTEALLRHLRKMPGAPDLTVQEKELAALRQEAAGKTQDDLSLFSRVCALRRRIAMANPLLDFDSLLFTGNWTRGLIQAHQNVAAAHVAPGAGIYRVEGFRGLSVKVVDLLADRVVENGRYRGKVLSQRNPEWRQQAAFFSMDLDFDGRSLAFGWAEEAGRAPGPDRQPEKLDPARLTAEEKEFIEEFRSHQQGGKGSLEAVAGNWREGHGGGTGGGGNGKGKTYARNYHIFRTDLEGRTIRQLTDSPVASCYYPCWMPDLPDRQAGGRIVFCSDGLHHMERCGSTHPTCNLFSMKGDGSDQYPISWHETNDWYPTVNHDGMLVYSRWDYVDRLFMKVHNIWTCYPDGRDPRAPHANYEGDHPQAELGIKAIPGGPGRFMAVAGGHHAEHSGNLILIDINRPDMAAGNWEFFWPSAVPVTDYWTYFKRKARQRAFWAEITPLSGEVCVAAEWTRILLVDRFGNEDLIYDARETLGEYRCLHGDAKLRPDIVAANGATPLPVRWPTPIRARPRPPIIPIQTYQGERRKDAPKPTVAVMNVYDSDFEWPAGTKITALRIVQIFPKPWPWTSGIDSPPIGWSRGGIARMPLGTVPVEEDGSAYFEAPIEREIYFQALNADGLAVQSMRTGTYVHPGEQLRCAGCHEDKWKQRTSTAFPLAMRRAPSPIAPEVGGVEPVNYWRLAKPVFDAKCAGCHAKAKSKDKPVSLDQDNLLSEMNIGVDKSLAGKDAGTVLSKADAMDGEDFFRRLEQEAERGARGISGKKGGKRSGPIGFEYWKGPKTLGDLSEYVPWYTASWPGGTIGGLRTQPGKFGAMGSKLLKYLGPEHHGVKLTAEERRRITLWMDCNSVSLGSFDHRPEIVKKQQAGELVWPATYVDPANPQGLQTERERPYRWPPFGDLTMDDRWFEVREPAARTAFTRQQGR